MYLNKLQRRPKCRSIITKLKWSKTRNGNGKKKRNIKKIYDNSRFGDAAGIVNGYAQRQREGREREGTDRHYDRAMVTFLKKWRENHHIACHNAPFQSIATTEIV